MAHPGDPEGFEPSGTGPNDGRRLVVVFHGWLGNARKMNDIVEATRDAYSQQPGLDLYVPPLDYAKRLGRKPAAEIVSELLRKMDAICANDRYEHIVLIGFSMGAVIARRLYLAATDVHNTVPNEPKLSNAGRRPWVNKVERIITLGGLNRGWLASGRLGWYYSLVTNFIGFTGHLWPSEIKPTIFEMRRGAPFIVQTRLQWLALRRSGDKPKPEPLVIQLLGTQDNLVAPDDAVDFAVDRRPDDPYFSIELRQTRHDDAFVFSPRRFSDPDGKLGDARRKVFVSVLTADQNWLEKNEILAENLADSLPEPPNKDVKHVVFIVHGIRDDGYWTRKIAQKIREKASPPGSEIESKTASKWRCVTSSYGYFAMLPFVLPWIRRQKVEWLMDEYVRAKASFPEAKFSYVGHSNGTYLVASALKDYPAACFRNVLFAGSVVRPDYDWEALLNAGRVSKVLNMVATKDWVVALFSMGLEPLPRIELGGAGFAGFKQAERLPKVRNLNEVRYVKGWHSAGVAETQWPHIANFIVNGDLPPSIDPDYAPEQDPFWQKASEISTFLLGGLILLVIVILVAILYPVFAAGTTVPEAVYRVILALLYLFTLRFVVTRV
jgi:pimeloyl-ACP methyl ester carboxylesterase